MTGMTDRPTPVPAGLLFPVSGSNSSYLSRDDHRSVADGLRNKWDKSCPPRREYDVFCQAEDNGWRDNRPQLWGLEVGLRQLGKSGERSAKFPDPSNATDWWHGYPVSARDPKRAIEHRPKPELVRRWTDLGLISEVQRARINRGKV